MKRLRYHENNTDLLTAAVPGPTETDILYPDGTYEPSEIQNHEENYTGNHLVEATDALVSREFPQQPGSSTDIDIDFVHHQQENLDLQICNYIYESINM